MIKNVLVTGGLGYIGSETAVTLLSNGYNIIIVDDLSNSKIAVLDRIEKITSIRPHFYQINCLDKEKFKEVFLKEKIDAIIHFAGFKAVGESTRLPLEYHRNNIGSALTTLELMKEFKIKNFVFSSSATVYGDPERVPVLETDPIKEATNPYGASKIAIEAICKDFAKSDPSINIAILRYFNPIGAHPSSLLGEDPNGIPNNLLPYISQVSINKLPFLHIYGNDYPTLDGTGIRDYIHVVDLAEGHLAALKKLDSNPGLVIYNLGTGKGTSVLELLKAFEEASKKKIPYQIEGRRPGDVAINYADCHKAERELNWVSRLSIYDACLDAYNFQVKNPNGIE